NVLQVELLLRLVVARLPQQDFAVDRLVREEVAEERAVLLVEARDHLAALEVEDAHLDRRGRLEDDVVGAGRALDDAPAELELAQALARGEGEEARVVHAVRGHADDRAGVYE